MFEVTPALRPLVHQPTVRLTTYRRDGRPVGTAVSIAVDGPRAFVRTFESAGKFKRIRNNPLVDVAPSTFRGEATGPAMRARVRILSGDEAERARNLIERKHPWLHGVLVPLGHRLTGKKTVYLELTPLEATGVPSEAGERAAA